VTAIYMINVCGQGFVPATAEDSELLGPVRLGQVLRMRISMPRNPGNHSRYFRFLSDAFSMQESYENKEHFRKMLQVAAGHCDEVIGFDGKVTYIPRSISWADLDEFEFRLLFSQVIDAFIAWSELDDDNLRQIISYG